MFNLPRIFPSKQIEVKSKEKNFEFVIFALKIFKNNNLITV